MECSLVVSQVAVATAVEVIAAATVVEVADSVVQDADNPKSILMTDLG